MNTLDNAISALKKGKFIVIHDGKGRENEADMVCLAEKITPAMVRQMRKDAGGLICLAIDMNSSKRLHIPFAYDVLKASKNPLIFRMAKSRMKYGDMPAFTISINHLATFTGIPDNDRAMTIREFGKLIRAKGGPSQFRKSFRAIGHVFLLTSRGIENRRGHTELSVALAGLAKITPAMVLCEMLSDSGRAATDKEAEAYAKKHKMPYLEGKQIVKAAGALQ